MIKLIATDLDGTFLNHLHMSNDKNNKAIDVALQNGVIFAIATGRHLHQNHRVGLKFLNRSIYKIAMNGAMIKDTMDKIIYKQPIDNSFIQQLKEKFPQISFEWITETGVYINASRLNHYKKTLKHKFSTKSFIKQLFMQLYASDIYFNQYPKDPILAIGARVGNRTLARQLKHYIQNHHQYVCDFGPNTHNFEIVASHVNKKEAVLWLSNYLNINDKDVAVYGNDINDVPMLAHFKQSFAPENAVDIAKKNASYMIESNKVNGVSNHIIQTIQNQTSNK